MSAPVIYPRPKPDSNGGAQVSNANGKYQSAAPLLAAAFTALSASIAIIDRRGVIVAVNDAWRRYADENGMRWTRYGIGYNYLSVLDNAAQAGYDGVAEIALGIRQVLAGRAASDRVEYSCETPSGCHFAQHATAFDFAGELHVMVSHENVTLRRLNEDELRAAKEAAEAARREAEMRAEVAERHRQIAEAVASMVAVASSPLRLEDALLGIVKPAAETAGSQAAAIYSAEARWDRLVLVAGCGALPNAGRKAKTAIPAHILAAAIADRRGVAVANGWQARARSSPEAMPPARQAEYPALLLTSIQRNDKLYGYLALFYGEPQEFGEDDVALAHFLGQQVTRALENAELRQQAEKTAIENERNRLARELHDAVTQTLFSASVVAEALPRVWERDPEAGRRALEELRLWTRGALAEMRTLLMELRPAALVEKPLPDLIRQLGEAAATRLCIPAVCAIAAEAEPPVEVKLSLYRIAQETLNNMAKHSHASRVEINYQASPEAVQLVIVDDGRGFDLDGRSPGQLGLGIMAERARHIGARLSIRSAPGAGTEVRVEWQPRGRNN